MLPDDVLRSIDELVGEHGRSRFLEDAAREKLERMKMAETLKTTAGIARGRRYRRWQDREVTAASVRKIRLSESRT